MLIVESIADDCAIQKPFIYSGLQKAVCMALVQTPSDQHIRQHLKPVASDVQDFIRSQACAVVRDEAIACEYWFEMFNKFLIGFFVRIGWRVDSDEDVVLGKLVDASAFELIREN